MALGGIHFFSACAGSGYFARSACHFATSSSLFVAAYNTISLSRAPAMTATLSLADMFCLESKHVRYWNTLGDKEQARIYYDKAVHRMDKNQPMNEEFRRFRAEAEELLGIK